MQKPNQISILKFVSQLHHSGRIGVTQFPNSCSMINSFKQMYSIALKLCFPCYCLNALP